jgi:hypothetical protein
MLLPFASPVSATAAEPTRYLSRHDLGVSAGAAWPICGWCRDGRPGFAVGGYAIVRPTRGFGYGFVVESLHFSYLLGPPGSLGTEHTPGSTLLLSPVVRGIPLRLPIVDLWIETGLGIVTIATYGSSFWEASGPGGTLGMGLRIGIGDYLRIGPYGRWIGYFGGRQAGGNEGGSWTLPAHVANWSAGITVGALFPAEQPR